MYALSAAVVFGTLFCSDVRAWPTGAGGGACFTMIPGHTAASKQTSASPFKIDLSASSISKDGLTVTITGKTIGENFQGFLIQARDTSEQVVPGTFTVNALDTTVKTKNCSTTDDSMTHTSATDKQSVSFKWTPPSNLDPALQIYFRATVAQAKITWWENITSVTIKSGSFRFIPSLALTLALLIMAAIL